MNILPKYTAPAGGRLTAEMLADYQEAGVLILEDFVSAQEQELQERGAGLVIYPLVSPVFELLDSLVGS